MNYYSFQSKVRSVGARQTRNAHSTDRTCGDLVCSGLYTAILTDTDGTFTGERGSVTSATDDKWNDPAWGRGDDKIPRAMMTDRRGRRKSIDEIRKYIGIFVHSPKVLSGHLEIRKF